MLLPHTFTSCAVSLRHWTKAANQLFADLVHCKVGISTEMAIRLSKAFGSTPETWLGMQMAYDLWQARELEESLELIRMVPPAV